MEQPFLACRDDFPILSSQVYGKPLIYLDNAATTQKPRQVVERISRGYYETNANIHRGVHYLSQRATELHEAARERVRQFLLRGQPEEITFLTAGPRKAINWLPFLMERLSASG
jgi:cysteine desulfurase/selenocysteine lyase